jgi:hypothetical protein
MPNPENTWLRTALVLAISALLTGSPAFTAVRRVFVYPVGPVLPRAWTGTQANGSLDGGNHCSGWASTTGNGRVGTLTAPRVPGAKMPSPAAR